MRHKEHITEKELVLKANGELSGGRSIAVRDHLAGCEACQSRLNRIEETFATFVEAHRGELDERLTPIQGARARLQSALAKASSERLPWPARFGNAKLKLKPALAVAAFAVAAGIFAFSKYFGPQDTVPGAVRSDARFTPDPMLTPGATISLSRSDLCASDSPASAVAVRRPLALEVFRLHGIPNPPPRAYELDYLIPPELGGAADVRNLWPQPYHGNAWNAYAKDALEDRLLHLVCEGALDLATAQRDLARDWVAAYKKYFRTQEPLVEHASFLKDEPWE